MNSRPLGRSAVSVTELALGAAPIGNLYAALDDESARATVDAAWAGGIRCYDTAPHYGLGLSERRLGAALRERPREQFSLCTKAGRLLERNPSPTGSDLDAGFAVPDDYVRRRDYTADGIRRSVEESLERLGVEWLDVVYVHDPEDHLDQAVREAIPALHALREEGLLRAVGVGMNVVDPLRAIVARAELDVVLIAGRFTLVDRSAEPLLDDCADRGVSVVAAAPFNSGLLAGGAENFDYAPAPEDVLAVARACAEVCEDHAVTLPSAALQVALRHPAVACVLAGMRTAAEVRADVDSFNAPVPESLWPRLPAPARV